MSIDMNRKQLIELKEALKPYKDAVKYLAIRMNKETMRKGSKIYGHAKEFTAPRIYNILYGSITDQDILAVLIEQGNLLIEAYKKVEKILS